MPPARYKNNWGDRDFIAVSPDGTIYLTWVYGRHLPTKPNTPFVSNAVIQKSADGGRTWSRITPVSPGYPRHGDVSAAPLLVAPGGRIDVLMWAGSSLRHPALPLHNDYFTSSTDSGRTWSRAVPVAPAAGHIGRLVTWIDANIGIDAAGTLYATWDTQHARRGHRLAVLLDRPRPDVVARPAGHPGHDTAEHIMAVAGGRPGIAYVASLKGGPFLIARSPRRFSLHLRVFSVHRGWLSSPIRVSRTYGNRHGWPGDTIGISVLPGQRVMLSWGIPSSIATGQIWATQVQHAARGFLPRQQQSRASLGSGPASAPQNTPSLNLIRKLGFVQVGTQQNETRGEELIFHHDRENMQGGSGRRTGRHEILPAGHRLDHCGPGRACAQRRWLGLHVTGSARS